MAGPKRTTAGAEPPDGIRDRLEEKAKEVAAAAIELGINKGTAVLDSAVQLLRKL